MAISKLKALYQDYYQSYCAAKHTPNLLPNQKEPNPEKCALLQSSEQAYREFKRFDRERLAGSPHEKEALQKIFSNTQVLRHRQKQDELDCYQIDTNKPFDPNKVMENLKLGVSIINNYFSSAISQKTRSCSSRSEMQTLIQARATINTQTETLLKIINKRYKKYQRAVGTENEVRFELKFRVHAAILTGRTILLSVHSLKKVIPSLNVKGLISQLPPLQGASATGTTSPVQSSRSLSQDFMDLFRG